MDIPLPPTARYSVPRYIELDPSRGATNYEREKADIPSYPGVPSSTTKHFPVLVIICHFIFYFYFFHTPLCLFVCLSFSLSLSHTFTLQLTLSFTLFHFLPFPLSFISAYFSLFAATGSAITRSTCFPPRQVLPFT